MEEKQKIYAHRKIYTETSIYKQRKKGNPLAGLEMEGDLLRAA